MDIGEVVKNTLKTTAKITATASLSIGVSLAFLDFQYNISLSDLD